LGIFGLVDVVGSAKIALLGRQPHAVRVRLIIAHGTGIVCAVARYWRAEMLRHGRLLIGFVVVFGVFDHGRLWRWHWFVCWWRRLWCRCRMSLRCRMLIEQCTTELHELRTAARTAAR